MNSIKLQKKIFKLYILLLPISVINIFKPIQDKLKMTTSGSSFIFHFIGLIILLRYILKYKLEINKVVKYLFFMILYLNCSSILMAIVLNDKLGYLHGENTYSAIVGMIIYYSQIFLIFFYNIYCFRFISLKELKQLFEKIIYISLIIGYTQIVLIGFPQISSIYDKIDILNILGDSQFILSMQRIILFSSEPAGAGILISMIIMPYILSEILENKKFRYKILFILFIPLIYFTKSSTVYIMIFSNVVIFLYFCIKNIKMNYKNVCKVIIVFILILISIIPTTYMLSKENLSGDIKYLFLEKISDDENLSTLMRKSTILNDFKVFKKYPLMGIGNGNQGFYYNAHITPKYLKSIEVENLYRGNSGIVNGGPFIPAFISGYGFIGVFLLIKFIIISINCIKKIRGEIGIVYEFYFISSIAFIIGAVMSTDIVGNYIAIFIFSIPFFYVKDEEVKNEKNNIYFRNTRSL